MVHKLDRGLSSKALKTGTSGKDGWRPCLRNSFRSSGNSRAAGSSGSLRGVHKPANAPNTTTSAGIFASSRINKAVDSNSAAGTAVAANPDTTAVPDTASADDDNSSTLGLSRGFYHVTARCPSTSNAAAIGCFEPGHAAEQAVLVHGAWLYLVEPDEESGRLTHILRTHTFAELRAVAVVRSSPPRAPGHDLLAVSSDSGVLTLLARDKTQHRGLIPVASHAYGRSGVRNSVPGEYLVADPSGRALLIAGVEGPKLIYTVHQGPSSDTQELLGAGAAKSPPGATEVQLGGPVAVPPPTARTFTYAVAALDVGANSNPIFAALEVAVPRRAAGSERPGEASYTKFLAFYELDLGTQSCRRLLAAPASFSAAAELCALPRTKKCPGGVLVFADDAVTWHHPDLPPVSVPLPRRASTAVAGRPTRVVTSCASPLGDGGVLCLVQSQHGDIFRLEIEPGAPAPAPASAANSKDFSATATSSSAAATDPTPRESLRISISAAYFQTISTALSLLLFRSGFLLACAEADDLVLYQLSGLSADPAVPVSAAGLFTPTETALLDPTHVVPSLAPLTSLVPAPSGTHGPLYGCGRLSTGTVRLLEHGHRPTELGATPLPTRARALFTLTPLDSADAGLVAVSFDSSTLVLQPGDEIRDCPDGEGLRTGVRTIWAGPAGDGIAQAHAEGLRFIPSKGRRSQAGAEPEDWNSPLAHVETGAGNNTNVALALSNGTVALFAVANSKLRAWPERLNEPAAALALAPDAPILAAANKEGVLRIYTLENGLKIARRSLHAFGEPLASLLITKSLQKSKLHGRSYVLHIGTMNGRYLQCSLSPKGELSRRPLARVLGAEPVILVPAADGRLDGPVGFALTTKCWALAEQKTGLIEAIPILGPLLHAVVPLPGNPQAAYIGLSGQNLRVFAYTPDYSQPPVTERAWPLGGLLKGVVQIPPSKAKSAPNGVFAPRVVLTADRPAEDGTAPVSAQSQLDLIDLHKPSEPYASLPLPSGSRALALASCGLFRPDGSVAQTIVVSRADGYRFCGFGQAAPVACDACLLEVYECDSASCKTPTSLRLLHATRVPQPVSALLCVNGRLLAGVGSCIVVFRLGSTQLLREHVAPVPGFTNICLLALFNDRLFAADSERSVALCVMYQPDKTSEPLGLRPAVGDLIPTAVTAMLPLDDNSVIVGDKFGNLVILAVPAQAANALTYAAIGRLPRETTPRLPLQFERQAQFRIAESITALFKGPLTPGGADSVCYTGIQGTIGVVAPVTDKALWNMLCKLQESLRQYLPPLVGRTHDQFRGYYAPQRAFVDGDLCDEFVAARCCGEPLREKISARMGHSAEELDKAIVELRARIAY